MLFILRLLQKNILKVHISCKLAVYKQYKGGVVSQIAK